MNNNKPIYFELNDWKVGVNYPNAEPFLSWMERYPNYDYPFDNSDFVKENKLTVVTSCINHSINFCIGASKEWVKEKCPDLLTKYRNFRCYPQKNNPNLIYSKNDKTVTFLPYTQENIGRIKYL